jgi:hypothetical protein
MVYCTRPHRRCIQDSDKLGGSSSEFYIIGVLIPNLRTLKIVVSKIVLI